MKSSHWKSSKYDIKKQQASVLADIMNTAVKDKIASSSFEAKQTENSTELREDNALRLRKKQQMRHSSTEESWAKVVVLNLEIQLP